MARFTMKVAKWLTVLVVGLVIICWLVLAAPFFSNLRKSIVADVLTAQIGQPLIVEGDVRVVVGRTTFVHVSDVHIPSTNIDDLNLAELKLLEWELNLAALFSGRIDLDNLTLDGLQANAITQSDGTTSWVKRTPQTSVETPPSSTDEQPVEETVPASASPSIYSFLSDKTVTFTNIGLVFSNELSGFDFDFKLGSILLEQLQGGDLVSVTGGGTVNGEEFTLDGKYPAGEPFTNVLNFGDIVVSYNGSVIAPEQGGGYEATLEIDTGEIGEVFDVLGLERSFEGAGDLSAHITSQPGLLSIQDLQSVLDLSKGQQISVTGKVDNLVDQSGFDVKAEARLHPEGQPPANADSLKDLKLTRIVARVVSEDGNLEFKKLVIRTNAFDQGLNKVGPISIGRIYRTEEKTLGLADVNLQAGPKDAPYITASGGVGDIFKFKEVDLAGTLSGPASLLLKSLSEEEAAKFGRVGAEFEISDEAGHLSLTKLTAATEGTDLWFLKADVAVENVAQLDGLKTAMGIGITDTASFLEALKLDPIDVGKVEFGVALEGQVETADLELVFNAGGSDLKTNISVDLSEQINVIRGKVLSERIRLEDLRDGTKALVQLGEAAESKGAESGEPEPEDDRPPIQPLVLEEESDVLDLERILTETDLEIELELKEFVGEAGSSSMSSTFTAKEGQINAGPIELFYGPGFFKLTAMMDAVEDPERLRVSGSTSGWDFGKILDAVGLGIDANGTLSAAFDVTGNISSGKTFVNSMAGSASLNMGTGSIATSLLELAGLGVFPWLFSNELSEGKTTIVCVKAPVQLRSGQVRFDSVVAETKSVQLVARGEVDWVGDRIQIRAEPRRVGDPLARSAWPFDVTGKLSDPKFKLDVGGSRSRRADGADQMPANRVPCQPDILQLE
ncbi:AsmA family protein [Shimia thalassica]|uniref:AsmA family protein n=1 Tax=Shimia thalassica TaxID=1715693 RepID=UPI0026E20D66|nr:AsmA-like C-terminal region-containing protein [Shimia thalassica]MDO6478976.1 AsmA-like C-terminal region-containing protein [Shimia thalassica]